MQFSLGEAATDHYDTLFGQKAAATLDEFQEFDPPSFESFKSPASHYRMRAEFKIWHEDGRAHYAMYKPGEYKKPVVIDEFSIGSPRINQLMPALLKSINENPALRHKLFQVEFLTTTTGDSVTTLIYHRQLDNIWEDAARELQTILKTKVIGRSRKQKVTLSEDFVIEALEINGETYHYQQVETGFTQPNAHICAQMLGWAQKASQNIGGDLLELYCGNGNFTLPLAKNFRRVLATEVSKTSVNSALHNISLNKATNIDVVRMSSEEFTQAMNGVREFRRLRDIDLDTLQFSTVFVDPPRAGLDDDTVKMIAGFDNIIYISCNPTTLKNNLRALNKSHKVESFAFFDQFPYTDHRECGVVLSSR